MDVVKMANKSFAALSKLVPSEELAKHAAYMRNLINSMVSGAWRQKGGVGDQAFLLPGFNIPKGKYSVINAFVPQRDERRKYMMLTYPWDINQRLVFLIGEAPLFSPSCFLSSVIRSRGATPSNLSEKHSLWYTGNQRSFIFWTWQSH
jgi:hypothetical protein